MQKFEESLEKKGQLDVIEFSLDHNVAAVAKGLSSSVSTANTFIKKISKRSSLVCISRYSLFKLLSFFLATFKLSLYRFSVVNKNYYC